MELTYAIAEGYDTKEPFRGTEHSAGLDIFIPNMTPKFKADLKEKNKNQARIFYKEPEDSKFTLVPPPPVEEPDDLYVMGHGRIIIPTGIRFNIPSGTYLEVANRGSTASQQGLIYGAHIIDEDYRGIVFINLINTTPRTIYLKPGTKLVQLIHKEYIRSTLKQVASDVLYEGMPFSDRGEGALGSTNNR